jgi:hypothetical protein
MTGIPRHPARRTEATGLPTANSLGDGAGLRERAPTRLMVVNATNRAAVAGRSEPDDRFPMGQTLLASSAS